VLPGVSVQRWLKSEMDNSSSFPRRALFSSQAYSPFFIQEVPRDNRSGINNNSELTLSQLNDKRKSVRSQPADLPPPATESSQTRGDVDIRPEFAHERRTPDPGTVVGLFMALFLLILIVAALVILIRYIRPLLRRIQETYAGAASFLLNVSKHSSQFRFEQFLYAYTLFIFSNTLTPQLFLY
jgi:hypothetical protein